MKKRIAVFHMLPSGGGIRVARQFASGLSRRYDLTVHSVAGGSLFSMESKVREIVHPYPAWKKPQGLLRIAAPISLSLRLLQFKKVCRIAAEHINANSEAVLVHNTMPIAAPPLSGFLDVPSLYFCYEYPRHIYEKDIIKRTSSKLSELALYPLRTLEKKMDKKAVAGSSAIAVLSFYMRKQFRNIYGRNPLVINPGVDTEFFTPGNSGLNENFILSVGALWPFKGHETAVRILSRLESDVRPELRIVADREFPGFRTRLETLAGQLSVKISVHMKLSNIELREFYRKAKLVLCCQRKEPYGLVPLEAMACGTPVAAIAEGGFTNNISHGETGYLFDGTPEMGSDLIKSLLLQESLNVIEAGRSFVSDKRNLKSGLEQLASALESL